MGNLTFNQILRYALSGGVVLLVLFGVHEPPDDKAPMVIQSLGGAAVLSGVALIIGCLVYSVHRASFLFLLNRLFQFIPVFRIDQRRRRSWVLIWPSDEEIDLTFRAWSLHDKSPFFWRSLNEWAAQVHFLLCSAWGILLGRLAGAALSWPIDDSLACTSSWIFGTLVVLGILHAVRYQRYAIVVLRAL